MAVCVAYVGVCVTCQKIY